MRISDWSSDVCSSDLKRAVAAAPDAFDERRDVGVEPDAEAVLQDQRARFLVDEGAAAGREYHRLSGEQARDHAALAVAEMRLAEARENVRNRHAGGAPDLVVGVGEPNAHPRCEPAPDRRLAGPHQDRKSTRLNSSH